MHIVTSFGHNSLGVISSLNKKRSWWSTKKATSQSEMPPTKVLFGRVDCEVIPLAVRLTRLSLMVIGHRVYQFNIHFQTFKSDPKPKHEPNLMLKYDFHPNSSAIIPLGGNFY